jgi:antitoxin ParD1/3/4
MEYQSEDAMLAEKVSISLPRPMLDFVERYKESHSMKSRSQVIETALELLRQQTLEEAYRESAAEADNSFDVTASDGLADEAW